MHTVERYHDFSAGHRVVGHESKCQFLHGHNYRVTFVAAPNGDATSLCARCGDTQQSFPHGPKAHYFLPRQDVMGLDSVGRVIDFSCLKSTLCEWLEKNWDHKMLLWREDPLYKQFAGAPGFGQMFFDSIEPVPFNPTAENMAEYLVTAVAPSLLEPYGVKVISCKVEETRKCSATYSL